MVGCRLSAGVWPEGVLEGVPNQWKLEMNGSHEEKMEWEQDRGGVLVRGIGKEMEQWEGPKKEPSDQSGTRMNMGETPTS